MTRASRVSKGGKPSKQRAQQELQMDSYKVGLIFLLLSWLSFLLFTWYQTDSSGRSWILYHPEDWMFSLWLAVLAAAAFLAGMVLDLKGRLTVVRL